MSNKPHETSAVGRALASEWVKRTDAVEGLTKERDAANERLDGAKRQLDSTSKSLKEYADFDNPCRAFELGDGSGDAVLLNYRHGFGYEISRIPFDREPQA